MTAASWPLVALVAGHGLLHLLGVVTAFGPAGLTPLTQPIGRAWGTLWLAASALVIATAVLLSLGSRSAWIVGGLAVIASQVVIMSSWRDAWAGTVVNAVLLLVVAHGFLTEGPRSFHAQYRRAAAAGAARPLDTTIVTEADLAPLPDPVQRYLRLSGAVGQPRVVRYRVRFTGRIRSGPDARWMPFEAEQQSFADHPTRLFLMRARMLGLPVQAFHQLIDGHADMRVTAAGLVPLAHERGEAMDRAETVTLFNDMCILAPGTLVDPAIAWEAVDATTARARFTHRGHTIAATLFFAPDGRLINFASDDRARVSALDAAGTARFSTPLRDSRHFGRLYLAGYGEARWHLPAGEFVYGEFTMTDVTMNGRATQ